MVKDRSAQEKNNEKSSMIKNQMKDSLEISETGYGYQSVPQKTNQNIHSDM